MKKLLYILPLLAMMASGCSDDEVVSSASSKTERLTLQFDAVIPVDEDVTRSIDGDPGVYEKFEKPHYLHTFVYVEQGTNKKVYHFQKTFSHDEAEAAWTLNGDRTCFHYTYDQTIDWASGNFQVGTNGDNPTLRAYMVASHEAIVFGGKSLGNGTNALLDGFTERDILDLTFSAQYNSSYINLRDIYSTPYNLSKSWTEIASPLTNREGYYGTLSQSLVDKKIFLVADTLYHTCAKVDFEWNTADKYQQNVAESIVLGAGKEIAQRNYLINENFDDNQTHNFGGWGDGSSRQARDGALVLGNNSVKTNSYDVQTAYNLPRITRGTTLIIEFKAKADNSGQGFDVFIQNPTGYANLCNFGTPVLTTNWQSFKMENTYNGDINDSRLIFNHGKYVGNVYLDDIKLYYQTPTGKTLPLTGYIFRPTENVYNSSYNTTYSKLLTKTETFKFCLVAALDGNPESRYYLSESNSGLSLSKIENNIEYPYTYNQGDDFKLESAGNGRYYIKNVTRKKYLSGDYQVVLGDNATAYRIENAANGYCSIYNNSNPELKLYLIRDNMYSNQLQFKPDSEAANKSNYYNRWKINSLIGNVDDENYYTPCTPGNKWSGRAYTYVIQPDRDVVDYVFTTSEGRSTAGSLDPKQNIRLEGCMSNVFPSWYKMNVKIRGNE